MNSFIVRHFILAKDFKPNPENNMFSAKHIYEYIRAEKYPAYVDLKAVLGVYFLNPNRKYLIEINVIQNNTSLGKWSFNDVTVDKPNEIVNIFLRTKGKLYIPKEGFVQFDIYVNDQKINTQFIQALAEEE